MNGVVRDAAPPQAAERRFLAVAHHLTDLLIIVSPDHAWEIPMPTSAAAVQRYGVLPLADNMDALYARVHGDDVPAVRKYVERCLHRAGAAGKPHRLRLRAADGHWHTMQMCGHDMLDDPTVGGVVLHLTDITPLAQTQLELRRNTAPLHTLLDSLDGGVLMENQNRRVLAANRPLVEMFNLPASAEALVGADCTRTAEQMSRLFRDPAAFLASVEQAVAGGARRLDEEFVLADGRIIDRDYTPMRLDDECLGHTWAYWDVTAQRRAQRRLKDQNQMLAEVAEMKTQFIASVSHELRTPLSAITGFTELLLTDLGEAPELLNTEQRGYLKAVDRNARRLLHLVNDLLFAARLESGRLPLKMATFDMAAVARTAVGERAPEADRHEVRLTADLPPRLEVTGDESRLLQVLDNLLSNAIKFSRADGTVRVTLGPAAPDMWQLIVADSGIGIPAKDLPLLFHSFYRAGNVRSTTPGTGLGLVISRAIVDRHGGHIEIDSSEGSGTTVTVTLPLQPPREEVANHDPHSGS